MNTVYEFSSERDASQEFDSLRSIVEGEHDEGVPAPQPRPTRYRAETELLEKALAGDGGAIHKVLSYLGSKNPDLRRIMQSVIHGCTDSGLWRRLVSILAWNAWKDWQVETHPDVYPAEVPAEWRDQVFHSIAEIFLIDRDQAESALKHAVLQQAISLPREAQGHEGNRLRGAAAYLLGLRADPDAIPVLEELIVDGDLQWQLNAIDALEAIRDQRCAMPLLKALTCSRQEVHTRANSALLELGNLAQEAWLEALHHSNSHIRWHAARGLGQIGDVRAVSILAEGLFDENHKVRWATARLLANLDLAAIPAILDVLASHPIDEPFRQAATHALHSMVSHQAQMHIKPLVEALNSPSAPMTVPRLALRMRQEWGKQA